MSQRVAILDYGMGNLHSVASAIKHISDAEVYIGSDKTTILSADRVIFPGVGAIGDCIKAIKAEQLDVVIGQVIEQKQALLGICVGMQSLLEFSEESGGTEALAIFQGQVKRFQGEAFQQHQLKVPHMGWSEVEKTQDHALWQGIESNSRFYFVHSYYVAKTGAEVIGRCHYGLPFAAMMARENIAAVQFHPEKSQQAGLQLLNNFLQWKVA